MSKFMARLLELYGFLLWWGLVELIGGWGRGAHPASTRRLTS
jgi:hypothetical protein